MPALIQKGMYCLVFGDILMRCIYATRPYEAVPGSANATAREMGTENLQTLYLPISSVSHKKFKQYCREIIHDFDDTSKT